MKREPNRYLVRRLFVMGAGASYSASRPRSRISDRQTPLDRDFTKRILELQIEKPRWVRASVEQVGRGWKDLTPLVQFGLEQAIIRQLGHLEFIDAIHPRRRRGTIAPYDWLNHLTHLITYILRRSREASQRPFSRFVEKAFPGRISANDYRDRIITFNYDDLLDRHVINRAGLEQTYFDRIQGQPGLANRRDAPYPHPLIIKLHGSVNWRVTEDEFRRIIQPVTSPDEPPLYLQSVWYAATGTPEPSSAEQPLIIPPLPAKPITQISLFRFLWSKAYEYLHEAEEIVLCGYSLPDADRLALSLFGNFTNRRLKSITVVDPDPSVMRKWRSLLRRRNVASARWTYYEDFCEYVEDMAG